MAKLDRIARVVDPRRWHARFAMLTIGLALIAVSCSGDDSAARSPANDGARSPSTATSSTSTTAPRSAASAPQGSSLEDEIIARYVGFWDARFAANTGVPNPDDPALREFATGEQLETVISETRANLERGLAFRRAANPSDVQQVSVIEVNGDRAVVQECVVADGVIIRRDTGEVVNDDIATHSVRGELVRLDGVWKVSSAQLVQRWEGVAGCARLLIVTLLCGAALVIPAPTAGAEERPGGSGGAYVNPDGDPTAVAGDDGAGGGSTGGSAGDSQCKWLVLVGDDFEFGIYEVDLTRLHSKTGRWLQYVCPPQGAIAVDGRFLIPEGGLVDPEQLAVDALASVSIQPPTMRTSPSANGRLYVQVPTWLWLERAWWQPYEATARRSRVVHGASHTGRDDVEPG